MPQLINYQGRVVVGTTNFSGTGQFRFALVNGAGTTTYWSNDGTSIHGSEPTNAVSITVTNGLYSVLLGSTFAIPKTVSYNSDVRLRVWFNDGTNGSQLLSPDQRMASVAYAFGAAAFGDTSTGAVAFTDGNELNLQARGGVKLNTGGDGTSVTLATGHGAQGNVLGIGGDINTAGKIIAGKMTLIDTVFGGGSLEGNDADFANSVSAQQFITSSDRNTKEQFQPVNAREILSQLASLPIQTWRFKRDDAGTPHIGPMAQDFYAAFQIGPDNKHIATIDADGVAFAAIQGLNEIVREQNAELAAKAKKIEALEKRLDDVEKTLRRKNESKSK